MAHSKEPWEMTLGEFAEYLDQTPSIRLGPFAKGAKRQNALIDKYGRTHGLRRSVIELALAEGKPVPATVLAEYHNLASDAQISP